eukprot:Rhum_TRINITY_DN12325_c1_g1::Rhum_TRINITY_DN12325_c1_g1_i1::g.51112::m.51112
MVSQYSVSTAAPPAAPAPRTIAWICASASSSSLRVFDANFFTTSSCTLLCTPDRDTCDDDADRSCSCSSCVATAVIASHSSLCWMSYSTSLPSSPVSSFRSPMDSPEMTRVNSRASPPSRSGSSCFSSVRSVNSSTSTGCRRPSDSLFRARCVIWSSSNCSPLSSHSSMVSPSWSATIRCFSASHCICCSSRSSRRRFTLRISSAMAARRAYGSSSPPLPPPAAGAPAPPAFLAVLPHWRASERFLSPKGLASSEYPCAARSSLASGPLASASCSRGLLAPRLGSSAVARYNEPNIVLIWYLCLLPMKYRYCSF